jgi:hypothetical protein
MSTPNSTFKMDITAASGVVSKYKENSGATERAKTQRVLNGSSHRYKTRHLIWSIINDNVFEYDLP